MKPTNYNYYTMWSGSLNMGDTPGVFNEAEFVGLIIQLPFLISFLPTPLNSTIEMMFVTSDVEIFQGLTHPIYFDWTPGTALPQPVGYIDDVTYIPGRKEYHKVSIPTTGIQLGKHSLTIIVNLGAGKGYLDDFVVKRLDVENNVGTKIGW